MARRREAPGWLLEAAEVFVRSVTDRWAAEGYQTTPEWVIKATAIKVANATYIPELHDAGPPTLVERVVANNRRPVPDESLVRG